MATTLHDGERPEARGLAEFLRRHRDLILEEWAKRARSIGPASALSKSALLDFLPRLLERIADLVEELEEGRPAPELPHDAAARHASDRLDEGFDLGDVVVELSVLRDTTIAMWEEGGGANARAQHRILDQAIDRAIVASVERFVGARDRTLRALDAISRSALEARDLDDLLHRLTSVLREHTPAVDVVAILLREGDRLRVRAAVGLEEEETQGFTLAMGEGFSGTIAAEVRPRALRDGSTDPLVKSDVIRARGVRALYGVPLVDGGEVLGVAHMGSLTAHEFSDSDRLLLESMASRATAGIYQHMLRDAAERRARELAESERRFRATFENAAVGMAHVALDGRWLHLNRKYCELLGRSEEELRRMRWQDVTHLADVVDGQTASESVHRGEREGFTAEKRYVRPDGTTVWARLTVSVVRGEEGEALYEVAVAEDVTARKTTEEALRLSEERGRLAIEAARLGTWDWDMQTGSLELSPACRATFGLPEGEAVSYDRLSRLMHPEERGPFDAAVRRALDPAYGTLDRDQRIARASDGEERWIALRAQAFFDRWGRPLRLIGTVLDVTHERRSQQRMRFLGDASAVLASSLDYARTLRHVAEIAVPQIADLCLVDIVQGGDIVDHVAVHRDPAMVQRLRSIRKRWGAGAADGTIRTVVRSREPMLVPIVDEARLRGLAVDEEHARAIGELGLRSFVSVPLVVAGDCTAGVLTLAQDGSGRVFTGADLPFVQEIARRASAAIENARLHDQTKRLVEARDQILGIVSHDLRNPLAVIDMASELLLGNDAIRADPSARRQVEAMKRGSAHMLRLIRDLLDTSSLQQGRLAIEQAPHDAAGILREAADAAAAAGRERGVGIDCELELGEVAVLVDRDRILQVLSNLLGNAIKLSEPGSRVVLHAEVRGPELFVSVRDAGPGISAEDLPRIFEPYWRKRAGGTGLGLFISKGIVEAHGGRIWADSRLGEGSTFWFTVPA